MLKKKLIIFLVMVLLLPSVMAWCILGLGDCEKKEEIQKEYGIDYEIEKLNKHDGILTIYQEPKYLWEDGIRKNIEEVKSFKSATDKDGNPIWNNIIQPKITHIDEYGKEVEGNDGLHDFIIGDANYTSVKLYTIILDEKEANKEIPVKFNGEQQTISKLSSTQVADGFFVKSNNIFEDNISFGYHSTIVKFESVSSNRWNDTFSDFQNKETPQSAGATCSTANNTAGAALKNNCFWMIDLKGYFADANITSVSVTEMNVSLYMQDQIGNASTSYNALSTFVEIDTLVYDDNATNYFAEEIADSIYAAGYNNITFSTAWAQDCVDNGGVDCQFGATTQFNAVDKNELNIVTKEAGSNEPAVTITYTVNVAPGTPVLEYPANNTNISAITSFIWFNANDSDLDSLTYNWRIATDNAFSTVIYANSSVNETGNVTTDMPSGLSMGGSYWWQVRADDGTLNGTYTDPFFFTFTNASVPTTPAVYPLNETTNQYLEVTCENSTSETGDPINYEFYADTNNPPTTLLQNSTNTTIKYELNNGTNYYRCRANNGIYNSLYSSAIQYNIDLDSIYNYSVDYVASTLETETNRFELNFTYNTNLVTINDVNVTYNNTIYTTTEKSAPAGQKSYYANIESPEVSSTTSVNFNYSILQTYLLNGTTNIYKTQSFSQTITELIATVCNGSSGMTPYLNLTFQDEKTGARINASIVASEFNYSLDAAKSMPQSLSYSNNTEHFSYAYCVNENKTIYSDLIFSYESTGYAQRNYQDSYTLTNITTDKTLYLTKTSDGIYVTFQVVNIASNVIKDVYIVVRKDGDIIESGYTDDAGTLTFFLNPNFAYTFTFSKTGYETTTSTITPSQSSYTITLGESEAAADYGLGIDITPPYITPDQNVLVNDTIYNFSYTIRSNFYLIDLMGFSLVNGSDNTYLTSASCSADTGCSASTTYNTGNYTSLIMNYYYYTNSTYVNGTREWIVIQNESFRGAFTYLTEDITLLAGQEGFNDFTKALFSFLIIFFAVASLSYVSGIYSPVAILGEITGFVWLLHMVNMLPTLGVTVEIFETMYTPPLIPVVVSAIFIGYLVYEGRIR